MTRTLASWELQALKEKAREHDINNGGYCDCRMGAVNFWSGPGNFPKGQENLDYTRGALNYPRNFIGTVCFKDLSVHTSNHELARWETDDFFCHGEAATPYINRPEDISWAKEQFGRLWIAALSTPVPELSMRK